MAKLLSRTRLTRLQKPMFALIQNFGFSARQPSLYHWQVWTGCNCLCNIWPTTLKLQQGRGKALKYASEQGLLNGVRAILQASNVRAAVLLVNKPQQRTPASPLAEYPHRLQARQDTTVDLDLDGDELRVIVNTKSYSSSVRLSAEHTATFLAAAVALAAPKTKNKTALNALDGLPAVLRELHVRLGKHNCTTDCPDIEKWALAVERVLAEEKTTTATSHCQACEQALGSLHVPSCGKRVLDCPEVVTDDCAETC